MILGHVTGQDDGPNVYKLIQLYCCFQCVCVCVCVCVRAHACMHMQELTSTHVHMHGMVCTYTEVRGGCQLSCSIVLPFLALRQCLTDLGILELGWQPASPRDPTLLSLAPAALGL